MHSESHGASIPVGTSRPLVVYLDQNKWIDLSRAARNPVDHPQTRQVLEWLCAELDAGRVRLPLTASNLYETHKFDNADGRYALAYAQATLSKGEVFRGRRRRLEVEVGRVLSKLYGLPWVEPASDWMISPLFLDAQAELNDPSQTVEISDRVLEELRADPQAAMFSYLTQIPEEVRRRAVADFEAGCEALRAGIESRRAQHRAESVRMRRRIYSVLLAYGEQDILIGVADALGLPWRCFGDRNGATMRAVVGETPTFLIEREIGLKLEAQSGSICSNDMRDMRNFTTVLPYADVVIAEKEFTSLARQAGLAAQFDVRLETDLAALGQFR